MDKHVVYVDIYYFSLEYAIKWNPIKKISDIKHLNQIRFKEFKKTNFAFLVLVQRKRKINLSSPPYKSAIFWLSQIFD